MVNIKKAFSILLIVAAIGVSFFSFNLKAHISSAASGTKYIYSASDLVIFANQVNAGTGSYYNYNVYLMNNIDMYGVSFQGIGTSSYYFSATFYGQNYTIKNLSVSGAQDRGFINYLSGTVRDLTISGGTINCNNNYSAGAFAGSMYNSAKLYNCINLNCSIKGYINNSAYLGGMVGYLNSSSATIEKCYSSATVHTTGYDIVRAGGIAGICAGTSTIKECCVRGQVYAGDTNTSKSYAGGIVGESKANISDCLNYATVRAQAKITSSSNEINSMKNASLNGDGHYECWVDDYDIIYALTTSDAGKSKCENTQRYSYMGGIAGKQSGGTIQYCINKDTTDYSTYGGYYSDKYYLYYLYMDRYWSWFQVHTNKTIQFRFYLTSRTNYFNALVGEKTGGTLNNCYHPNRVTTKCNESVYYVYDSSVGEWRYPSSLYDYKLKSHSYIDCNHNSSGISFSYYYTTESPSAGETKDGEDTLFSISFNSKGTGIQPSTSLSTITNRDTSKWALDGSTPRLKHFYWADNAVKPS